MKPFFFRHGDLAYLESRYAEDSSACYGMHSHPTVSIGLVVSGHSIIEVNKREYQIKAGDIVMFNPEQPHMCNPVPGTKWSYHMIYFDSAWWDEAVKNVADDTKNRRFQVPILRDVKLCVELCRINRRFFDVRDRHDLNEIEISLIMWVNNFMSALEPCDMSEVEAAPKWIAQVQTYLEEHFDQTVKLEELCHLSGVPVTQLIRKFKRHCGLTPYAYLQNYKINRARDLLAAGQEISDVAYQLGFADQSHLHRLFKRLVASTPKGYQRSVS